jgi:hypothetical protein
MEVRRSASGPEGLRPGGTRDEGMQQMGVFRQPLRLLLGYTIFLGISQAPELWSINPMPILFFRKTLLCTFLFCYVFFRATEVIFPEVRAKAYLPITFFPQK